MTLYSAPPVLKPFSEDKPTLLVCWWITAFCTVLILLRVAGRFVRVEKLFAEDRIAAAALLPLFLRVACVHVVLLYGTNNANFLGTILSSEDLDRRTTGSRLVLASRIFDAATLWTLKVANQEFYARLTKTARNKAYTTALLGLRIALGATFLAVVIATLAECQPIFKYWQVLPDPGGQCRQGFAQLITMAACSAITDLLLVVFPIPLILASRIPTKRKVFLILLFSCGVLTVCLTIYRVPQVINARGDQAIRSMWASVELLVASAVANAQAIGSFMRDTGVKKKKFKYDAGVMVTGHNPRPQPAKAVSKRSSWDDEELGPGMKLGYKVEIGAWKPEVPAKDTGYHPDVSYKAADGKESGDRSVSPTQSQDYLIPRDRRDSSPETPGQSIYPRQDQILVTTSYETHHVEPERVVPASGRGVQRGSAAVLRDMSRP